ncbi:hypothetical protein HPB48_017262 [Haemaphysalis longicornis]|uniref:Uncharacterized protein n=1 Tax=Haemaphysalis longicornis TaxID=44386 RepID=A0A9J6GIB7_HAELO|nr:hypothetical protein HPB48_017262 [Haemaphysalis longicornis]
MQSDPPAEWLEILPTVIQAVKLPAHAFGDISLHLHHWNHPVGLKKHHIIVNHIFRIQTTTLAGLTIMYLLTSWPHQLILWSNTRNCSRCHDRRPYT